MINLFAMAISAALVKNPEKIPELKLEPQQSYELLLEDDIGVSKTDLETLIQAAQNAKFAVKSNCDIKLSPLNKEYRKNLVLCLSNNPGAFYNRDFFKYLLNTELELLMTNNSQTDQTSTLLEYIMDIYRSINPQNTAWFEIDSGFINVSADRRFDYPFQEGDIILAFASTATSGLISFLPSPSPKLSHAMFVKKSHGQLITIESQPHTGTREFNIDELYSEKYFRIIVLRWTGKTENKNQAIALASEWARRKKGYDIKMNADNSDFVTCTELAGAAYAESAKKDMRTLFPFRQQILNSWDKNLVQSIGFNAFDVLTARSILQSTYFKVIAEYRNTNDLVRTWQIRALTKYTSNRYKNGAIIIPQWPYAYLKHLYDIPFVKDLKIVMKAKALRGLIGEEAFATLASYEKSFVEKVINQYNTDFSERFYQISLNTLGRRMDQIIAKHAKGIFSKNEHSELFAKKDLK